MDDLDWTYVKVGTEEGVVVAVFVVVVKGEPGVGEPGEVKSVGLYDKRASLIAPNNGIKSLLLHGTSRVCWGRETLHPSGSPSGVRDRNQTGEYRAHAPPPHAFHDWHKGSLSSLQHSPHTLRSG